MNKSFKENTEEYNAKYMNKIQAELQEVLPHLAIGFVKQRMKHYNMDKRYLPPGTQDLFALVMTLLGQRGTSKCP